MKNATITIFISGMRSAFDILPDQSTYQANFIKNAKVKDIDFHALSDINESWMSIATCQKNAFKKLTNNLPKLNISNESTCY
ncbi:hypothetical protein OW684_11370 [Acinetobacter baumannii]|uniref:hypothetical protein n=1 Tax=Acinetobacter baumannii TaxID=470 RepID=UPI000D65B02C|nr:hypothetical protein [Acinetobacter baumannii]MCA4279141.1 hypothetical protein [Acinetobacter baumannii]MDC4364504.1 hypothetical protein [Acinetobacter baumannii]MDC4551785.1 hypothetical protein [Acinetobacter baumannii]MDC4571059.1 hypothetical protein [Acinetobacter baumannii]MDC4606224.1 hypothetical protein [Acinetobacter baumannii]